MELAKNIKSAIAVPVTDVTATGTVTGNVIDRQGYNAVTFVAFAGTVGTGAGTVTPIVKSGSASGSLSAVDDDLLVFTEAGAAFGSADDDETKRIGYVGNDRYVAVDLSSSNASVTNLGALAILSDPVQAPVAQD